MSHLWVAGPRPRGGFLGRTGGLQGDRSPAQARYLALPPQHRGWWPGSCPQGGTTADRETLGQWASHTDH